jgi:hypothetical protein
LSVEIEARLLYFIVTVMFRKPRRGLKLVCLKSGEKLTFTKVMLTKQIVIENRVRLLGLKSKSRLQVAVWDG